MMLMLRSTHRRISATVTRERDEARDFARRSLADRDTQRDMAAGWEAAKDKAVRVSEGWRVRCDLQDETIAGLRAEIERLTPKRDARGHFIKQESK
jgi:hypothetical protein